MTPENYNNKFFNVHAAGSIKSAERIIPLVLSYCKPVSLIDIGCGIGAWLSIWKKNGITEYIGIDGEYVDKKLLLIDENNFQTFNLEKGYSDHKKYDLVTCLEVAEHIAPTCADNFTNSLCSLGNLILFSAAIPGQEGTQHLNEQYPKYWIELFRKYGFVAVDCLRMKIWDNNEIEFWYRQNILFFVREESLAEYPALQYEFSKQEGIPHLVHPELFDYKCAKANRYETLLKNPIRSFKYFISNFVFSSSKK